MKGLDPDVARALPDFDPDEWEECKDDSEPFILWWRMLIAGLAIGLVALFFWFLEQTKKKHKKSVENEKQKLGEKLETDAVTSHTQKSHEFEQQKYQKLSAPSFDEVVDYEPWPEPSSTANVSRAATIFSTDHHVQASTNPEAAVLKKNVGVNQATIVSFHKVEQKHDLGNTDIDSPDQDTSDMSSVHDSVAMKTKLTQHQKDNMDTFYEMAKQRAQAADHHDLPQQTFQFHYHDQQRTAEDLVEVDSVPVLEDEDEKAIYAFQMIASTDSSFAKDLGQVMELDVDEERAESTHSPIPFIVIDPGSPDSSLSPPIPPNPHHDSPDPACSSTNNQFDYEFEQTWDQKLDSELVEEEINAVIRIEPQGLYCRPDSEEMIDEQSDNMVVEVNGFPQDEIIDAAEQVIDAPSSFVSQSVDVAQGQVDDPMQSSPDGKYNNTEESPGQRLIQDNQAMVSKNQAEAESNRHRKFQLDSGSQASGSTDLEEEYLPSMTTAPEIETYAADVDVPVDDVDIEEDLPEDPQITTFQQKNEPQRFSAQTRDKNQDPSTSAGHPAPRQESIEESSERKVSLLEAAGVTSAMEALLKIRTLEEVSTIMRKAGLHRSNLIFGIDYTASNKYQGEVSFAGHSLHSIRPGILNPYQQVINIMGKTLAPFATSGSIPVYGFGDVTTSDWSVFPLKYDSFCKDFDEVLQVYNKATPKVILSGPTNFAPLIFQAMEICRKVMDYHILVIVADGQVTNERATRRAIVDACGFPLSIIVVGVGDGPWDMMRIFDESLPKRTWDNFHFVEFEAIVAAAGDNADLSFAVQSLLEIPDQYKLIKKLGLINATPPPP